MSIKHQPKVTADIIPGVSKWPACNPFGDISSIYPRANALILVLLFEYGCVRMGSYAMP